MSSSGKVKIIKTQKRIVERQKSPIKKNQDKFEQLYENYKTIKAKNELLKQRILSEREKNEFSECTFTPKLTKMKNMFKKKPINLSLKAEALKNKREQKNKLRPESNFVNLVNRQNEWLENKNNKLNKRIVTETMKKMERCVFEPKLQKVKKKTFTNLKTEASKIIEKPDSYMNFINKNRQFRKNKSNSKLYEYPITKGLKSPLKSKSKILKVNKINDYDYTRHLLTERSYVLKNQSNSNLNNNVSITLSNKSFFSKKQEKRQKSIPLKRLKINNYYTVDEIYKMVYFKEREKMICEIEDYTDDYMELLFKGKEKIPFKKAMERLHYALINLDLNNEVEKNGFNGNDNLLDQENKDNRGPYIKTEQ